MPKSFRRGYQPSLLYPTGRPSATPEPVAPPKRRPTIQEIEADIEEQLAEAEILEKAPVNPCAPCLLSRVTGTKFWALANILIAVYTIFDAVKRMVYLVKQYKQRDHNTNVSTDNNHYNCRTEPNSLSINVAVVNLVGAIIYFVTSMCFCLAVAYFQDYELRLKFLKAYMYSSMVGVPVLGHLITFINDIGNCHNVWQFLIFEIVEMLLTVVASVLGYLVTRSYIFWLDHPETVLELEETPPSARRRSTLPSITSLTGSSETPLKSGGRSTVSATEVSELANRKWSISSADSSSTENPWGGTRRQSHKKVVLNVDDDDIEERNVDS